ncbi:MAG: thiamine pyrophosphate-binding protein [Burkholderiaceae bacterium]
MTKTTGAKAIAQMLKAYDVSHIFMVPAVLRRTMAELEAMTEISRLHVHSEASAAYMADGYARASGRPGVCMAQVIGALNLAAGLRDAWLAHSPVIAITGGRDPSTKFKRVYQEVDDLPAFEPVTKLNATIDNVERIPDMLRQAFRAATSGCPGPVHLQFRGNEGQIDQEEGDMDVFHEAQHVRSPAYRFPADSNSVKLALEALAKAKKPIFVIGGGARHSAAGLALKSLCEGLNIPFATSLNGKDVIPGSHPLSVGVVGTYSRESANRAVLAADLVCFVGSETGSMVTNFWKSPKPGARVIQIDIEPTSLGLNYKLEVSLHGDARTVVEQLLVELEAGRTLLTDRTQWILECEQYKLQWRTKYQPYFDLEASPIRPEKLCDALTKTMPDDALVVVDTGHAGMWMGGMFDLTNANQGYIRSAGHLGWAFPASLGAKCAQPNRPVVCFTGDAGFWYHIAEIEVAVRWGIHSITVVNNNSGGNQSKRGFDRAYGGQQTEKARELWTFRKTDFAAIASSIGAVGFRVESAAELEATLKKAYLIKAPVVIDVVTDIEALAPVAYSE